MKVHRFPAFKGSFIFVNVGVGIGSGAPFHWSPTPTELENICSLAADHKLSAKDLGKIPGVQAEEFEEIKDDHEYVFLLNLISSYTDDDVKYWGEIFQELAQMPDNEYKLVVCPRGIELKRMKKNLLVFM